MNHRAIRQSFLDFFQAKKHVIVPSAPVIPAEDPTLMFTNAGMNQFKDIFLGLKKPKGSRVTDSQKCIRVSGKHNDLEEVGYDTYHHTFFEMLGNWSFGDYYKKEAIEWSWELLTQVWKLPKDKLYATVYHSDDEAFELWQSLTDIDHDKILRFDEKDNFWEMGATGPCGPCSEIHIDLGESLGPGEGKDPKTGVNSGSPRFIEIWNLVFIQNNRRPDGTLEDLQEKHVDTGMGFERISCVLQNKTSNYDTDIFTPIIHATEKLSGKKYEGEKNQVAMRVIADHLRAVSFSIADGVMPSNEGRGYVIRRILRRAYRYGRNLGFQGPFLHQLFPVLEVEMGDFFPELKEQSLLIQKTLLSEEEMFHRTLDNGLSLLEEKITTLPEKGELSGEDAFVLYDTYGFPLDLTALILKEKGYTIDQAGFDEAMARQKKRSRKDGGNQDNFAINEILKTLNQPTLYIGEEKYNCEAKLIAIIQNGESMQNLQEGESLLLFDQTVFYAESGGQIGDEGTVTGDGLSITIEDTKKNEGYFLHQAKVDSGVLKVGKTYTLKANAKRRQKIKKNHSATHLLQKSLRAILGEHVKQAGSVVTEDKLRFDFNHFHALTPSELEQVEDNVNQAILENFHVDAQTMSMEAAKQKGALAFFGEKYGDEVRVIDMGGHSIEFCGGSHVKSTGEIGSFHILSESSSASGIRRIEATTGWEAYALGKKNHQRIKNLAKELQVSTENQVLEKVLSMGKELKELKKQLTETKASDLKDKLSSIEGEKIEGIEWIYSAFESMEINTLRDQIDQLKNERTKAVIFFTNVHEGKIVFLCGVTKDLIPSVKAGDLVKTAATLCGGGGGGRPDFAQAGGKNVSRLTEAIEAVKQKLN